MKTQTQRQVTDKVKKLLAEQSFGPSTHGMRNLEITEAVLNVTIGLEDAPELVVVCKSLSLAQANMMSSALDMEEVQIFGAREKRTKNLRTGRIKTSGGYVVELSGYVDGKDWL